MELHGTGYPGDPELAAGDEFRDGDWQLDSTLMCHHWKAKHQDVNHVCTGRLDDLFLCKHVSNC